MSIWRRHEEEMACIPFVQFKNKLECALPAEALRREKRGEEGKEQKQRK